MDAKAALLRQWQRDGGRLPPAPDGLLLAEFDARALAAALEHEINRAHGCGHTKISTHMELVDAAALAAFLRRALFLGA